MPRINRFASLPSVLPSSLPPSNDNSPKKKRRKQSILDLLAFPAPANYDSGNVERHGKSTDGDYKNIPSSKERVENALWMFKKSVLTPYEDDPVADNLKEEVSKFMAEQVEKGLVEEEMNALKIEVIVHIAKEKKAIDTFKVLRIFGKTVISYADIVTDVLVLLEFMLKNKAMAIIQGISLGLSLLIQCIWSLALGQPLWVGVLGLIGMKPLLEAWRNAVHAKPFPKQRLGNEFMLMLSRMIEVLAEAIPQSLIQTVALLLYPDQRSYLQFVSLLASFLTTGFMVATADRDLDTNQQRRENEPVFYGYAKKNSYVQIVSSVVCFTCYKAAKMLSLALLISSAPPAYSAGLLVLEYFVILLWRKKYGNWRFYPRGTDAVNLSRKFFFFFSEPIYCST